MNPLFAAAVDLQDFARAHGWQTSIIGGLAVQRWGEPRQTRDVDVALLTGFGGEERFVDALLARYVARRPDARQFALERRVLLIQDSAAIPATSVTEIAIIAPSAMPGHSHTIVCCTENA